MLHAPVQLIRIGSVLARSRKCPCEDVRCVRIKIFQRCVFITNSSVYLHKCIYIDKYISIWICFFSRVYIYTWKILTFHSIYYSDSNILTFHSIYYSNNDMLISALRVFLCASHKNFEFARVELFSNSKLFSMFLASKLCFSRRRAAFREPSFVGSALVMVACHDWGWGLGFTCSKDSERSDHSWPQNHPTNQRQTPNAMASALVGRTEMVIAIPELSMRKTLPSIPL